jgi:hypothetical protein
MRKILTFEGHSAPQEGVDWAEFALRLGQRMRSGENDYGFSEEEYYVLLDDLERDYSPEGAGRKLRIGGRQAWSEVSSGPAKVRAIGQVAAEFGPGARVCDLGCGLGIVVHFCDRMGLRAMGVEYQRSLKAAHDSLGIKVVYGDLFKMDLGFLRDQDVIYLYQPVKTTDSSLALLELVHGRMRADAVVLYNGMWDRILHRVAAAGQFDVHPVHRDRSNDSNLVLLTRR